MRKDLQILFKELYEKAYNFGKKKLNVD